MQISLKYSKTKSPSLFSQEMGVSQSAAEMYLASDVIDLHIDTFIWNRLFQYDLEKRHSDYGVKKNFLNHVDFPRLLESEMTGSHWIITTNPFKSKKSRSESFLRNLDKIQKIFEKNDDQFRIVRNCAEYNEAKLESKHAIFIGVQGGNCFEYDLNILDQIPRGLVSRVTLIHLMTSNFGETSTPSIWGRERGGLTKLGVECVKKLNQNKIMIDLAHISRKGFWDAFEAHDKTQPLFVTHTGVCGVYDHWRNLTDDQIKAIAGTGGVIGIMFQRSFLAKLKIDQTISKVVDHMEHVIKVAGEDHVSIGSDFDGCIIPPDGLETCLGVPKLVDGMLQRGWGSERIRKILGGNFLRSFQLLRG